MIKDISIIGAGGFGREIKQLIDEINLEKTTWKIIGFFDSHHQPGTLINGVPVIGRDDDALRNGSENIVIAIGDPAVLKALGAKFLSAGKRFPNISHPTASFGDRERNKVGFGNVFTYGFHMTTNVELGNFNIFNTRVTLGHDVKIGSHNVFLPNVQLSGNVSVGDENVFGLNSSVLQKKKIGSRNTIGAHSFVATDLTSEQQVFGIPAVDF